MGRWLALAACCFWMGTAGAQEIRCTQVFMNASEQRICGTEALLVLDREMGELARRAAPHVDSIKSDQRKFRRALKTCKGDEPCLVRSYENRIAELKSIVNTLAPPSQEDIDQFVDAGMEADRQREGEAAERERLEGEIRREAEQERELARQSRPEINETESAPPPPVMTPMVEPEVTVPSNAKRASPDNPYWWVPWGAFLLLIGGAAIAYESLSSKLRYRCPKCRNWGAGDVIDSDDQHFTDYRTESYENRYTDRQRMTTGYKTGQRTVPVAMVKTRQRLRCRICNNEWLIRFKSRA